MSKKRLGRRAKWLKGKFESHEKELVRYVFSLTNDLEIAREVVQESFLKLCEEDHRKVDTRARAWLYTVCRNKALDIMKKERKMVKKPLDEFEDTFSSHPLDDVQNRQNTHRLLNLLRCLSQKEQDVIRLKFQNGMSYKEIAEITQYSVSNVGFILHTGLKKLKSEFEKKEAREKEGGAR